MQKTSASISTEVETKRPFKLSATALSTFLDSPKKFYWRYILNLSPITVSVATYDHDRIFGVVWAAFTDRFYKGIGEAENLRQTMDEWVAQTDWCPEKQRDALTRALEALAPTYYQMFSPSDGCRHPDKSELWVENDRFCGKLDGLSADGVIHEVKSTKHAQSINDHLWKVQNSLQVRLYAVLAKASGSCIEFAYKDTPYSIFRGPVMPITDNDRALWEQELNALADYIYSLGDDPYNYACHPDGCCITSRFMNSICPYQILCEQGFTDDTQLFYMKRESQQERRAKETE